MSSEITDVSQEESGLLYPTTEVPESSDDLISVISSTHAVRKTRTRTTLCHRANIRNVLLYVQGRKTLFIINVPEKNVYLLQ